MALEFASAAFRDDTDIVLAAVRQTGHAIRFASPRLQMHKNIGMAAVATTGNALRHLPYDLKNDPDVVCTAVVQNSDAYNFQQLDMFEGRLCANKDLLLPAVRQHGIMYLHATDELRDDYEVAFAAISNDGSLFTHIEEKFQLNPIFALIAVKDVGSDAFWPRIDDDPEYNILPHIQRELERTVPIVFKWAAVKWARRRWWLLGERIITQRCICNFWRNLSTFRRQWAGRKVLALRLTTELADEIFSFAYRGCWLTRWH